MRFRERQSRRAAQKRRRTAARGNPFTVVGRDTLWGVRPGSFIMIPRPDDRPWDANHPKDACLWSQAPQVPRQRDRIWRLWSRMLGARQQQAPRPALVNAVFRGMDAESPQPQGYRASRSSGKPSLHGCRPWQQGRPRPATQDCAFVALPGPPPLKAGYGPALTAGCAASRPRLEGPPRPAPEAKPR